MKARQLTFVVLAVINGLASLPAALLTAYGAPPSRRIGGTLLLATAVAAFVAAVVLLRRGKPTGGRSLSAATTLAVPPLLILAAINNALPLGWPVWAGGPLVGGAIIDGPLTADMRADFHLPPSDLQSLGSDGVSVSIRPSFGAIEYDVDLAPAGLALPGRPNARLWVRPKGAIPREYRFHVPWEDLEVILRTFDARAQHWRGQRGLTVDGTAILVERVKAGRTSSVETNTSADEEPNNPAAQLRTDLHALLLAYGPTGAIPRRYDWHVDWPAAGGACSERALNTPATAGTSREAACTAN